MIKRARGETFRPFFVPLSLAQAHAKHFPYGQANEGFLKMLIERGVRHKHKDTLEFRKAAGGQKLTIFSEVYNYERRAAIVFKTSPAWKISMVILSKFHRWPMFLYDLTKFMLQSIRGRKNNFVDSSTRSMSNLAGRNEGKPD